jgi:predicted molibdopterin-dependent oxidoreductase YjgC
MSPTLIGPRGESFVEMYPEDARILDLTDGQKVKLASENE